MANNSNIVFQLSLSIYSYCSMSFVQIVNFSSLLALLHSIRANTVKHCIVPPYLLFLAIWEITKEALFFGLCSYRSYSLGGIIRSFSQDIQVSSGFTEHQICSLHRCPVVSPDHASGTEGLPRQVYRDEENGCPDYWQHVFSHRSKGLCTFLLFLTFNRTCYHL